MRKEKGKGVRPILAVGLLLCMCGLFACGEQANDEEAGGTEDGTQATATVTEAADITGVQPEQDTEEPLTQEELDAYIAALPLQAEAPVLHSFRDVTVHDPSVLRVDGTYYIFGSHLAAAKSENLIDWTLIDSDVKASNTIIPNAKQEMEEAFTWAKTNTFWAPDVIQLADGRFYMYYCNCEGSSPLSALGVAVADAVEGPYEDLGIILKSGMSGEELSEDGDRYDATVQPNVVDPCVFFDAEGRLWMVYGSYSGGIYILELNPETGFPLTSGYGTKLLGANHLRIEGAFIQYVEETGYYYMFLSFGGLAADGGYNIRVCRSKTPDGIYMDAQGNNMLFCKGANGTFFHDATAEKYGTKLMGNFEWKQADGELGDQRKGYVSPGHNSTIYEEESGKYFLIFHTRFARSGEFHQVRVHQMYLNEEGWFVVSPYRYVGETAEAVAAAEVAGAYKLISHGTDISAKAKQSVDVLLTEDGRVHGAYEGTWTLDGDNTARLTLDGSTYTGVFLKQWDEYGQKNVMVFTVLCAETGTALWGSGYAALAE